jgi:hypothetical protein
MARMSRAAHASRTQDAELARLGDVLLFGSDSPDPIYLHHGIVRTRCGTLLQKGELRRAAPVPAPESEAETKAAVVPSDINLEVELDSDLEPAPHPLTAPPSALRESASAQAQPSAPVEPRLPAEAATRDFFVLRLSEEVAVLRAVAETMYTGSVDAVVRCTSTTKRAFLSEAFGLSFQANPAKSRFDADLLRVSCPAHLPPASMTHPYAH